MFNRKVKLSTEEQILLTLIYLRHLTTFQLQVSSLEWVNQLPIIHLTTGYHSYKNFCHLVYLNRWKKRSWLWNCSRNVPQCCGGVLVLVLKVKLAVLLLLVCWLWSLPLDLSSATSFILLNGYSTQ